MHAPPTITEPARPSRSPSQAATLMLALFVFAAIPAVSIAQGLDAAVLAELMRETGRTAPAREPGSSPKGLKAAVSLANRLNSTIERISRPRASISQRLVRSTTPPITASDPPPITHDLRAALTNLPPPVR